MRVQQRHPVRLDERPDDAAERGQRPEQRTSRALVRERDRCKCSLRMSCVLIPSSPRSRTTGPAGSGVCRGLRGERRRAALEGEAEEAARRGGDVRRVRRSAAARRGAPMRGLRGRRCPRRSARTRRASAATALQASATSTASTAKTGSADVCSHGENSGQRPAAALLGVGLDEVEDEVTRKASEPEPRREHEAHARHAARARSPTAASSAVAARAAACARTKRQASRRAAARCRSSPRRAGTGSTRRPRSRRRHVPAEVEAVGEAAAGEFRDQREQPEGQSGREAAGWRRARFMPLGCTKGRGTELSATDASRRLSRASSASSRGSRRASKPSSRIRCHVPRHSAPSRERDLLGARAEQHAAAAARARARARAARGARAAPRRRRRSRASRSLTRISASRRVGVT